MNKTWLAAGLLAGCCASLDAHAQSCPAGRIFRPSLGVCQPKSPENARWLPNGREKAATPRVAGAARGDLARPAAKLPPVKPPDPKAAVKRAAPAPRIAASPAPAAAPAPPRTKALAAPAPRPVVPPLPRSLAGGDIARRPPATAVTARPEAAAQGEAMDLSVVKAASAAARPEPAALTSATPQRAAAPAPAAASASPAAAAGPRGATTEASGPAVAAVTPQADQPIAALGYGDHALLPYSVPFLTPLPPPEARTVRSE